jgi:hypothetical protein
MFASKDVSIGLRAAYPVARSVRLRASATAYLSRTPTVTGNTTTFTYSVWAKRGSLSSNQYLFWGGNNCTFGFGVVGTDELGGNLRGTGATNYFFNTIGVFRDPSAWYHIVLAVDTTQATDTNRLKIYVNGVQQTLSVTYPPQNTVQLSTAQRNIGAESGRYYFDGYMAEANFIDGQALTPSSFGAYNIYGVWQPKQYTGTYGTNGFYLKFADNSTAAALGTDYSGNSNTWTVNNINVSAYSGSPPNNTSYDSMTDVPTLTNASVANYPTLNPTAIYSAGNTITASNGNLTFNQATCTANTGMGSSFLVPTGAGLFYYEITQQTKTTVGADSTQPFVLSVVKTANGTSPSNAFYYWAGGGGTGDPAGATLTGVNGTSIANSDVIMVAIDLAAGKLYLGKNGTWLNSAVPASGTGACATNLLNYATISPAVGNGGGNMTNFTCSLNFGQRPFSYTAPTGFVALNTYNLSAPPIPNGATVMAATTYTGTGATQSITNTVNSVSFQPDFVWFKSRATTYAHALFDSVRGVTKGLETQATTAEQTSSAGNDLAAFTSTGFTVGAPQNWNSPNNSGSNPVAWQWKANGTGVSNTSGSITSTVSAGATQGFSVVTYTGTGSTSTVGHGLGAIPSMVIVKTRSNVNDWMVKHINLTSGNNILLDSTAAQSAPTVNGYIGDLSSSTTFSVVAGSSTSQNVNASGWTYVAYVFAPVAGYSAFGSYAGNSATDGPFIYLGFKPRWIMIKNITTIGAWLIIDTSRQNYNVEGPYLVPNTSDAETTGTTVFDLLSNGFKCRSSTTANSSGSTYIYACFAENPFKYSLAR